jgi:hypothetical protein
MVNETDVALSVVWRVKTADVYCGPDSSAQYLSSMRTSTLSRRTPTLSRRTQSSRISSVRVGKVNNKDCQRQASSRLA